MAYEMSKSVTEKKPEPIDGKSPARRPDDPFDLFTDWMSEAEAGEPDVPNAASLATTGADGWPNIRMVLLKGCDGPETTAGNRGFVFYTNLDSVKAREIAENPRAALCFHWKSLKRQVRIAGTVSQVSDAEADAYFATRPRLSQIGAWASHQSAPLDSRFELERRVARFAARFAVGSAPRPEFWSGFRIVPCRIEFWRNRPFRLHDRQEYCRNRPEEPWSMVALYP